MGRKELRNASKELAGILAENLRTYRKINGLSQETLADMCGLHRTYVGSVERGERNATLSTLEAFATALRIPVPRLLTKKAFIRENENSASGSYPDAIRESGLSIYDPVEVGDPNLWIPAPKLERLLGGAMTGVSLAGLPLRTRSKLVKGLVCGALGYMVPSIFRKTRPRFPGQDFDVYVQKSNNLQVWNEELAPSRRYVIIRIGEDESISGVRVVEGRALALLDMTGTLTQKYQARLSLGKKKSELISDEDTDLLSGFVRADIDLAAASPTDRPQVGNLLPIGSVFRLLRPLIGKSFPDAGYDQERNRGAALHRLVCRQLKYADYRDDGRFPDIRHQLLEVKLQTSPTIDLGLLRPDSEEALDIPRIGGKQIRCRDVRYALFYGNTDGKKVWLTHLFLSTGEKFFERFPQSRGKVLSRKLQMRLPENFFDG